MYTEKIKIRISGFVHCILVNDCQAFGFVKKDNSSNINAFLNKIVPSLLQIKKERRKKINELFSNQNYQSKDISFEQYLYSSIDAIIDKVYFQDEELEFLTDEVWLRPIQKNIPVFDEIVFSEIAMTKLDLSVYLRQLLNEYARLPQYKRETICFSDELQLINLSYGESKVLNLTYGNAHYQVVVLNYVYGFVTDQYNYIMCYDLKSQRIAAFYLFAMQNLRILDKKFVPEERVTEACEKIITDRLFIDKEFFEITEVLNEK